MTTSVRSKAASKTKPDRKAKSAPNPKSKSRKKPASKPAGETSVAIIGGGISGIAAAIKLLRAGFSVTIFERYARLGGNTSSECVEGVEHDVYPHMFCDWYDNFWDLYENELGRKREDYFDARPGVKMFKGGDEPYQELFNPTTMNAIVANLKSGVMSPAEMLLMGYSTLDLAGYPFNREGYDQLDKISVNGQLYSSNTSTEPVAQLMNYMLQLIWSIKAEQTSAATYQDFLRHNLSFPNGAPFAHMLKDSLQDGLVAPLEALLRTLKADIRLSTTVSAVRLTDGGARISWGKTGVNQAGSHETFDSVVMAVPNVALRDLVLGANVGGSGGSSDLPGDRIIDREPSLAETRRLRAVPIPVLDLYLKRKLPGFPVENIGLAGAKYGLSVVDIAQLWPTRKFGGNTALVIAASDGEALPSHDDEGMARAMMLELQRYYPQINIGMKWGDPDCDIDWTKTHFRSNAENALFLNEVGSWDWRPASSYPTLPGLFFAGDLARGNVDMATVEGAVESGVRAASLVQAFNAERYGGAMRGKPITIVKHTTYGDTALRAAKLALMPFAYAAKALTRLKQDDSEAQLADIGKALQSEHIALLPMQFALDWWTTAYWFWNAALSPDEGDQPLGPSDHDDDNFIGLGAAALMVLGEMASYASEQCRGGGGISDKAGALAGGLSAVLGIEIPKTNAAPKRRWRPKR